MHDASGLFFTFMVKAFFGGPAMESLGTGAQRGLRFFLPFYFLNSAAACYTEGGSDGCKEGDCNLQNCFPGTCFHNV